MLNRSQIQMLLTLMHYEHYTTLIQALDLLYDEWEKLNSNYTNYDKCKLVWQQIVGYLQRSLPAIDRFFFARGFDDKERTPHFKYDSGSFPDVPYSDEELSGVGFEDAIFGVAPSAVDGRGGIRGSSPAVALENAYRAKMSDLQNLCNHIQDRNRPAV